MWYSAGAWGACIGLERFEGAGAVAWFDVQLWRRRRAQPQQQAAQSSGGGEHWSNNSMKIRHP